MLADIKPFKTFLNMKILLQCLLIVAFVGSSYAQAPAQEFLNNLSAHCGKAYEGKIVTSPIPQDFSNKELIMYVSACEDKQVKIAFFVGDDLSRTWVFTLKEDDRIELKHDHRLRDGSEDQITMYGGTSSNVGFDNMQFFPADQHTANMIPYATGNVWWVTIKDNIYSYNLKRVDAQSHFSVEFDLTKEIQTQKRAW